MVLAVGAAVGSRVFVGCSVVIVGLIVVVSSSVAVALINLNVFSWYQTIKMYMQSK